MVWWALFGRLRGRRILGRIENSGGGSGSMWALHFLFTMFLWIWRLSCPWVQLWAAYVFSSTRVGAVRRYSYQLKICCFATNNCTGSPNNRPQNTAPLFLCSTWGSACYPCRQKFRRFTCRIELMERAASFESCVQWWIQIRYLNPQLDSIFPDRFGRPKSIPKITQSLLKEFV